jgi:hypothetical protein
MGVRAAAVGHACVCKTSRYNFQFPNYYTYLVSSWRHTYILSNILGIYNSTTNFQEFYPNYYYASGRQNMLGNSSVSFQQINNFYAEKVQLRRIEIKKAIETVAGVIQDILKGVEYLEPRFISTFTQTNGRYDGVIFFNLFFTNTNLKC